MEGYPPTHLRIKEAVEPIKKKKDFRRELVLICTDERFL